MTPDDARLLLARPVPLDLAAATFVCDQDLLAPAVKDGMIPLGTAFRLARREAESVVYARRSARRSALVKAQRARERASRSHVDPDVAARALAALRRAAAAICRDLAARLLTDAPRLSDLSDRAAAAVLAVDPATALRPTRRTAA